MINLVISAKSYKGPSKENRHDSIIRQALLLDADLVPLAMQMYPGNESEKPYIRKVIEEIKQIYKVSGKQCRSPTRNSPVQETYMQL